MATNLVVAIFSGRTFLQVHALQYGILAVFPLDGKHGLLHFTLADQLGLFLLLFGLLCSIVTE